MTKESYGYVTLKEREIRRKESNKLLQLIINDINSDSKEKLYFNHYKKINNKNCRNENNACDKGCNYYANYHGGNNVVITGLSYSASYGYSTPSIF